MTAVDPALHPDPDLLVAHAAGQLDLASRVLMEAHCSRCCQCRTELEELRHPGGRYLEQMPDDELAASTWQGILDALPRQSSSSPFADTPLPAAARAELDEKSSIRWLRLPASSARIGRIENSSLHDPTTLILATVPSGKTLPRHLHLGGEQVVVLAGGYRDDFGHFVTGDFARYSPGTSHRPDVDDDESCWVVSRIEGGIRLCGWRGWLQSIAIAVSAARHRSPRSSGSR